MTTKETNKTLNRRELLKALAATGGAVTAATMLPGKWTKPVIEAGVLPVHAATSQYILNIINVIPGNGVNIAGGGPGTGELEIEVQIDPAEAGVDIEGVVSGDFSTSTSETTNADGKTTLYFDLCDLVGSKEVDAVGCGFSSFTVTVKFSDQGTYGTDTDSVSGTLDLCVCSG